LAAGGSVCRRDELVRLSAANNLVTQMRGRAAAIRRSVNRRHNLAITGSRADSSEASSTGASAQHNQTQHNQINRLGHWQCLQPPPCAESPQLYRASDHRFDGPRESRRSTTDPALCEPPPSATSWLRGHDSAPHWGSCGKPPSPLYVRNGGAVSRGYAGANRIG